MSWAIRRCSCCWCCCADVRLNIEHEHEHEHAVPMLLLAHNPIMLTGHRPILPASDAASVKPGDWLLASAGPVVRSTCASSLLSDRIVAASSFGQCGTMCRSLVAAEAGLRPGPWCCVVQSLVVGWTEQRIAVASN